MTSPEKQDSSGDWLIVGLCGVPIERIVAINLCRHYGGRVLFREKDVMVIEFGSRSDTIDELLGKLPMAAVTHLWRVDPRKDAREAAFIPPADHFLRQVSVAQNCHSVSSRVSRCRGLEPRQRPTRSV